MALSFKERLALAAQQGTTVAATGEKNAKGQESGVLASSGTGNTNKSSRFGQLPVEGLDNLEGMELHSTVPATVTKAPVRGIDLNIPTGVDLGKVIEAHNTIANKATVETEAEEVDPLSGLEASSVVKDLQQRIHNLATLEDGVSLKGEVGLLKTMITNNGDACRYLLDEDLGLFVRALRRMTDNKVAQDMSRAKPSSKASAKEKTLSAADVAGLLNDLDLEL